MTTKHRAAALLLALALAACDSSERSGDAASRDSTISAAADTGGMQGMAGMDSMPGMGGMKGMDSMSGMGGMQGMMGGGMDTMHTRMQSLNNMSPDSLQAMVPMHRQMAANMLSRMTREMRDMNMRGDAAWTATVDSVRQDLTRMPEIGRGELQGFFAAHHGRMMRLMTMHQGMMKKMGM